MSRVNEYVTCLFNPILYTRVPCAITPLHPNELAPPHCVVFLPRVMLLASGILSSSARACYTCGLRPRSCTFCTVSLQHRNPIILVMFTTPAVDSMWPVFPFMPEIKHILHDFIFFVKTVDIALTSIGSPNAVPVPWASNKVCGALVLL